MRHRITFSLITLLTLVFMIPRGTAAAALSFEASSSAVHAGDTVLVTMRISDLAKPINVIDGSILISDTNVLAVTDVSVGGSSFTLWPVQPVYDRATSRIRFTGGVPGGTTTSPTLVFRIIMKAQQSGTSDIILEQATVYANDGHATPIIIPSVRHTMTVSQHPADTPSVDAWHTLLTQDTTPPEPFPAVVSSDIALYDGHPFISFLTTDADSGIAYYEVQEGSRPAVQTTSPYVLQDQALKSAIRVRAYDLAGNTREATITVPQSGTRALTTHRSFPWLYPVGVFVCVLVLILIIMIVWKRRPRKRS
jgi:hypothetical protein